MDPLHAFFLGLLIAWIPCLAIMGWLVWRAPLIGPIDASIPRGRTRTGQRKRSYQQLV